MSAKNKKTTVNIVYPTECVSDETRGKCDSLLFSCQELDEEISATVQWLYLGGGLNKVI